MVVPRDEHPVGGHHQVRLDHVRALLDGQLVGGKRMFRPVAAGAAMGDDERRLTRQGLPDHRRRFRTIAGLSAGAGRQGQDQAGTQAGEHDMTSHLPLSS